jgi:hypothetical protein
MLEHERGIDVDLAGADGRAAEKGVGTRFLFVAACFLATDTRASRKRPF